jgi:glycerophosphoryl diester phosphodiesterase
MDCRMRMGKLTLNAMFWLVVLLLPGHAGAADAGAVTAGIKLFAHRGHTLAHPENSLPAIQAAMDLGISGTEIDLRTTRDGHVVLVHDATVDRTTNGQGSVQDMLFKDLRQLVLTRSDGQLSHVKIPRLAEVLALVSAHPSFELALDLKAVDVQHVARMVLDYNMLSRTLFFIADPMDVNMARTIKAVHPALRISVDLLSWWKIEGLPTFVVKALDADMLFASEWFFPRFGFAEARDVGVDVVVYLWGTHDLATRFQRAVDLGARVISSERPDQLLPWVHTGGAKR